MVDIDNLNEMMEFATMEPETIKQIWRDVKANHDKLDKCEGPHEFKPIPVEGKTLVRDYLCSKCGGKIDAIHKIWYERGLEHGKNQ